VFYLKGHISIVQFDLSVCRSNNDHLFNVNVWLKQLKMLEMTLCVEFQFYAQFKFHFPLFLGMVMYVKQRELKFEPRIKLNYNNYIMAKLECEDSKTQ